MTRLLAGGGEEVKEPRRGWWEERERWSEVVRSSFADGKLSGRDYNWTTATARPDNQKVKSLEEN